MLRYLGAYTHRVAISNHRLVRFENDEVTFRWRDSAHKNKRRLLTLPVDEFLRRFLLHVLPRGFVRIRHFGFLAARRRTRLLSLCAQLLSAETPTAVPAAPVKSDEHNRREVQLWECPLCGGSMVLVERLTPARSGCGLHPRTSLPEMLNALYRPSTTPARSVCRRCVSVKTIMPHSAVSTAFMASPPQVSASPSRTQALRICCPPQKDQTIVADCEHRTRHGNFQNP